MLEWLIGFIEQTGYFGIALLMLAENIFPPIPSEVIMPLAGYTAARGHLSLPLVILSGTAGALLGGLVWFYLGRWLGAARLRRLAAEHGRWLTMTPDDVDKAIAWFQRYGAVAVLVGRLVPAVRTLISVPAGISDMPMSTFLLFTSLGTFLWTGFLAGAGYLLADQYERVSHVLNPASNIIFGALVLWYLYRVATFPAAKRGPAEAAPRSR